MAPKYHPTPLSGGDRKALSKELGKARAMANILAAQSTEMRAKGEAMIQQADRLLCESWNERMWSDGEPIDPSPTIDQAVNGGFPMAGDPVRAVQDAERRRPRGDEASSNRVRARPRQPAELPEVRQGGAASVGYPTPACVAAAPSPTGSLKCAISIRSPPTRRPSSRCFAS